MDIWRETTTVRFECIDRSDRLTLTGIFGYFQEAAINHATVLGVGREAMETSKQGWVLSRLSLFVKRRPRYRETIEVSSWPRRWDKLFALRDYAIKDDTGDMLVRGRSAWLVLDIEKRRPLRAQTVMEPMPPNEGIDAFPEGAAGLRIVDNLEKAGERIALYSDIDYYGHANNVRYVQWMQDASDIDIHTNASQIRLDINYLSEVLPGQTVEIWSAPIAEFPGPGSSKAHPDPQGPSFAFEGRRPGAAGEPATAVFRAELFTGGES
ncbi:MAG: thioesterase [Treponema sp.]|nr:thioesterase [Treponema sp.]